MSSATGDPAGGTLIDFGKKVGFWTPAWALTNVQFTVIAAAVVLVKPTVTVFADGTPLKIPPNAQVRKAVDVPSFCMAKGRLRKAPSKVGSAG